TEFQPDIEQVLPAVGVGLGLEDLDGVAGRYLARQVDVVGIHGDDAPGGLVVDVVLAGRLPDGAIDRRQVGDVHFLDVFLGELDLRGGEAQHIGAAVGQRHCRGMLVGAGGAVV